jgi:hypothetical protein
MTSLIYPYKKLATVNALPMDRMRQSSKNASWIMQNAKVFLLYLKKEKNKYLPMMI